MDFDEFNMKGNNHIIIVIQNLNANHIPGRTLKKLYMNLT